MKKNERNEKRGLRGYNNHRYRGVTGKSNCNVIAKFEIVICYKSNHIIVKYYHPTLFVNNFER